jgi:hypothetical protein
MPEQATAVLSAIFLLRNKTIKYGKDATLILMIFYLFLILFYKGRGPG